MITKRLALLTIAALVAAPMNAFAAGHAHEVRISNFAFSPASLTVKAGDTITFINDDGAPHTATADDGSFDTGRLNRGDSASVTVTAAGTFSYKCAFHPRMTGSIVAE